MNNILQFLKAKQPDSPLPIGQLVAYSDMANPYMRAAVVEGGNEYGQSIVFENGRKSTVRRSYIEGPGGWELVNRVLSADELSGWVRTANMRKIADEEAEAKAKAEKAAADQNTKVQLLSEYPKLERTSSKKAGHVLAASNLRTLLKAEWPLCKFSVTSKSFSGGNSVSIHWADGPTTEEVEKISNRFEMGSFDGMTDCYNYERSVWTDLFGAAKYVKTSRNVSDERMREVADEMGYTGRDIKWGDIVGADYETNAAFRREYHGRSYYAKPTPEPTPEPAKQPEPVNPLSAHAPCLCW